MTNDDAVVLFVTGLATLRLFITQLHLVWLLENLAFGGRIY